MRKKLSGSDVFWRQVYILITEIKPFSHLLSRKLVDLRLLILGRNHACKTGAQSGQFLQNDRAIRI